MRTIRLSSLAGLCEVMETSCQTGQGNKGTAGPDNSEWIDARKRFHLSHAHVQMARELGTNPKKLGNKGQRVWETVSINS